MLFRLTILGLAMTLAACSGGRFSSRFSSGYYSPAPLQCVPYARAASGLALRGDAYSWWDSAAPVYERGRIPESGAVLVLAQTSKMPHGHVAVVKGVIDNRQIDITHSNWGNNRKSRSRVYELARVQDVSANNDWSLVRIWNHDVSNFGFPYAAKGFIYHRPAYP